MFLSGVLSKRDGRAEEPDVDGVALALPPVAGKGDRQLWATDGHAPVLSDDRGVVGICKLITGGGGGGGDFLAFFGREDTSSSSLSSVPDSYRGFGL